MAGVHQLVGVPAVRGGFVKKDYPFPVKCDHAVPLETCMVWRPYGKWWAPQEVAKGHCLKCGQAFGVNLEPMENWKEQPL